MDEFDFNTYNGTGGYVKRPASKERALKERAEGTLSANAAKVLDLLESEGGASGLVWEKIGFKLGLHHGQVSGLLSNMHSKGFVFALKETREGCHPYVASTHRGLYKDEEIYEQPVRTSASTARENIADLLAAIQICQDQKYGWGSVQALNTLANEIKGENK